jgi:hypothetical protein
MRSQEKALKRHQLPADFVQKLKDFVDEYSSDDKGGITIEIARMQADPCVAEEAVDGKIDFSVSGDSNMHMYVGPNGPHEMADIMLKDIRFSTRKETIECCKVCTGQKSVADLIESILRPKLGRSLFEAGCIPNYPVFSGV